MAIIAGVLPWRQLSDWHSQRLAWPCAGLEGPCRGRGQLPSRTIRWVTDDKTTSYQYIRHRSTNVPFLSFLILNLRNNYLDSVPFPARKSSDYLTTQYLYCFNSLLSPSRLYELGRRAHRQLRPARPACSVALGPAAHRLFRRRSQGGHYRYSKMGGILLIPWYLWVLFAQEDGLHLSR